MHIAAGCRPLLSIDLGLAGVIRTQDVQGEDEAVDWAVSEQARKESQPRDAFDLPCWVRSAPAHMI